MREMGAVAPADCTIVIPAYNEEHRIGGLLDELDGFEGPVIVVADGTDRTVAMVEAHAAGITITESCPSGCYRKVVELSACAASENSGRKLASLKETISACSGCQSEPTIVIAEQNGSQTSWKRPSHITIDLPRLLSPHRQ